MQSHYSFNVQGKPLQPIKNRLEYAHPKNRLEYAHPY